jgi:hypothetical protein
MKVVKASVTVVTKMIQMIVMAVADKVFGNAATYISKKINFCFC